MNKHWGWASSVGDFLSAPRERWLAELTAHHRGLMGVEPSSSQVGAWIEEHEAIRKSFKDCLNVDPDFAASWSVVFEYELPLEGGRRPDVVVLTGRAICVLEFKSRGTALQADIDQVTGYVRDIHDYHAESAGLPCEGLLVLVGARPDYVEMRDGVPVIGTESIANYLLGNVRDGYTKLEPWLDSGYRPLPTLVEAARKIFRDEELPHVNSAISAGIPQTVEVIGQMIDTCASDGRRMMAFVTGVPGAGKTLVGLRVVYERAKKYGTATFLSGNGPLVQVLQDALQSRVFVRDLHAYIKTYALNTRLKAPDEHIIVFDEAQRAWDQDYMLEKKRVARSEPSLLVEIGNRIPDWAALVGLVGEGQEIHSGEEAGIQQWNEAVSNVENVEEWTVFCSPKLAHEFEGVSVVTHPELDLNTSLRSKRADSLHEWVRLVLQGSLSLANQRAETIHKSHYPIYVTRSINLAKGYARLRYDEEPNGRFGLLASSHAKNLVAVGVDNSYPATSNMSIAKWFNAPTSDPKSSNALIQPITEFGCQGLELDLPILCWGEDLRWGDGTWIARPIKRRYQQNDPVALLKNSYRVLLTRGRDGLVIYVPEGSSLDSTEVALLAAGVKRLDEQTLEDFATSKSTLSAS